MTSTGNAINVLRATYSRGIVSTACAVEQQFDDYGRRDRFERRRGDGDRKAKPVLDSAATTQAEFDAIKAEALA